MQFCHQILWKSVEQFFRNLAYKQTNADENITSLAELNIVFFHITPQNELHSLSAADLYAKTWSIYGPLAFGCQFRRFAEAERLMSENPTVKSRQQFCVESAKPSNCPWRDLSFAWRSSASSTLDIQASTVVPYYSCLLASILSAFVDSSRLSVFAVLRCLCILGANVRARCSFFPAHVLYYCIHLKC